MYIHVWEGNLSYTHTQIYREKWKGLELNQAEIPANQLFLSCVWYCFFAKAWLPMLHFYMAHSYCQNISTLNARAFSGSQQGRPDDEEDFLCSCRQLVCKSWRAIWMNEWRKYSGEFSCKFPKEVNLSNCLLYKALLSTNICCISTLCQAQCQVVEVQWRIRLVLKFPLVMRFKHITLLTNKRKDISTKRVTEDLMSSGEEGSDPVLEDIVIIGLQSMEEIESYISKQCFLFLAVWKGEVCFPCIRLVF